MANSRKAPHSQFSTVEVTTGSRIGRKMFPAAAQVQHHPPGDRSVPTAAPSPGIVPEQEQSQPQHVDFSTDTGFAQEVVAP